MRSKFTVEYLKTRGGQNSSDNRIEFLGSLLVRISCQMNFACLNRSMHAPPTLHKCIFRCEEHLYKRLRPSVGRLVGPSPTMRLRGKLVTSRLLREEEEEEETDYVAIPLRRDSITSRFHYVAILSHLGIRWSPCLCQLIPRVSYKLFN
jgi:hypothetical protein